MALNPFEKFAEEVAASRGHAQCCARCGCVADCEAAGSLWLCQCCWVEESVEHGDIASGRA